MKVEVRLDPSLQPSSLAEGLQGGPRPPPLAIDAVKYWCTGVLVGEGDPSGPYDGSRRGCEAYDGPHW